MGAENQPAKDHKIQTEGGERNAEPGRCPPVDKYDSVDSAAPAPSAEGGIESAEPRRPADPIEGRR